MQDEMTERMAEALAAKVREAVDGFPGDDEQKRAILARIIEKLNES